MKANVQIKLALIDNNDTKSRYAHGISTYTFEVMNQQVGLITKEEIQNAFNQIDGEYYVLSFDQDAKRGVLDVIEPKLNLNDHSLGLVVEF